MERDLINILQSTLEERCSKNPKYSLRAFARDLGISAPRLSRWLRGKEGLSSTAALALAKSLGLNASETENFVLLVQSKHARSKKIRAMATSKLKRLSDQYRPLDIEAFKVIADWYNLAVLELANTENFDPSPASIASRLNISVYQAEGAIRRLTELGMLEEDSAGKLRSTGIFYANPTGVPSQSVRSFHTQILEKAIKALEFQQPAKRDYSALVLAVDSSQLDEARQFIKQFRDQFEERFGSRERKRDEVFALGIQFFHLSVKG